MCGQLALFICINFSLLYCLFYRYCTLRFLSVDFLTRRSSIAAFWLLFFGLAAAVATLGASILSPPELVCQLSNSPYNNNLSLSNAIGQRDFDIDHTLWAAWPFWRMDTVYLLVDFGRSEMPLMIGALVVTYALCWCSSLAMALLTLFTLRAKASMMSARTHAMHRRLIYQLYTQVLMPVLLLLLPAFTTIMAAIGQGLPLGNHMHAIYAVWISLWAPLNALVTIYFVTPYRRFTLRLLARCMPYWDRSSTAGACTADITGYPFALKSPPLCISCCSPLHNSPEISLQCGLG